MFYALKNHWPEYLMEGAELGLFMISACVFTVLLFHPVSPIAQDIHNEILRRLLMGIAMGSTAIAIIFSPLGKRSGAHFNPAVTLTFLRLGKVKAFDATFFILFQFAGGIAGVLLASLLLGNLIAHQSVNYAATVPGRGGALHSLCRRSSDHVHPDVGGPNNFQPHATKPLDRTLCRSPRRDLHHLGVANLRYEHEPGAHFQFGFSRKYLDVALDLFHSAAYRNAFGC